MDRRRQEEEQRAMESRRKRQLEVERLRRHPLSRLSRPLTRDRQDLRPPKNRVVDEYYVRGVQSPQASTISKRLGIDSQDSQGVTTNVDSTPPVASPGVSTQSATAKPSVTPMQLDHNVIVSKLIDRGVPHCLIRWLCSYLNQRRQAIRIDGQFSQWLTLAGGMPQGSLIGPLTFILLIDD